MPIYEYRCANCGRKNSRLWLSISAAETNEADLKCERCGQPALRRMVSRFTMGKSALSEGEELYEFDRLTANVDDSDAGELDRFAHGLGGDEPAPDTGSEPDQAGL